MSHSPPPSPSTSPLSLTAAALPLVTMFLLFVAGGIAVDLSAELIIVVLIGSATVAGAIAVRRGATWDAIQQASGRHLAGVLPVLLILLAIGALIGAWILSGTIPVLVYWGIQIVNPQYIALTAFLATAVMSSFTGTSWGSASTLGVAMVATGAALEAPLPLVAGAVVSGAYFGDKMSPLSDSTVIASIAADVDLYKHIRHLTYTAGPSFVLCLIVYLVAGMNAAPGGELPASALVLLDDIERAYSIHFVALVPALVVLACIVTRVPAALAIALSALVAALIGIVTQGFTVHDAVRAVVSGFTLPMIQSTGVDPASVSDQFSRLVQRGGLYSMATTLVVVISAFLLTGAMEVSGALTLLIERLMAAVRSTFALIAATMAAGAAMIALTSHGGVTMLVVGSMFRQAYDERGLARKNLSRTLEDSITITEPLMPWTVSAIFMATTLGVPTTAYAPWAVFCYGGPFFSLLIAALYEHTGYGIARRNDADPRW